MVHNVSRRTPRLAALLAAALAGSVAQAQSVFTPAELSRAGHVLRRMQHGASIFDYPQVLADTTTPQSTKIVNYILAKTSQTPINAGAEANNLLGLYPFPLAVGLGAPTAAGHVPQSASSGWRVHELAEASIIRAIWSEDTLREVMARFWAEHFNTNWGTVWFHLRNRFQNEGYANPDALAQDYATYFEWQQNDLFRTRAFGTFRSLLEASAGSADNGGMSGSNLIPGAAMMIYLDSVNSQGPKPNENYARELFELHTMGPSSPFPTALGAVLLPNYSYQDILDGAAIFSGWTLTNLSTPPTAPNLVFSFRPTVCGTTTTGHVTNCPTPGSKTLFDDAYLQPFVGQFPVTENQTLATEGLALLDHLANSPATAYFISEKLYRLFIKDVEPAPFDPLIMQCVNAWYTLPGGNIQGVLQVLFTSNEFINDTTTRWTNERQPLDAVAQTVDTFHGLGFNPAGGTAAEQKARITRVRFLIEEYGGQYLFRYGPPDGFTRGDCELVTTSRMLGATRLRQELYTLFGPFTTNYPSVFFDYFANLGFLNWTDPASIVNWFNFAAFNNELSGGDQTLLNLFLITDLNENFGNTLLTDAATNFPVFVQRVTTGLAYIACHTLNSLK